MGSEDKKPGVTTRQGSVKNASSDLSDQLLGNENAKVNTVNREKLNSEIEGKKSALKSNSIIRK